MPKFIILGAGRQGLCAAYDLGKFHPNVPVILADSDSHRLSFAKQRLSPLLPNSRFEFVSCDASEPAQLSQIAQAQDAILSCVPYRLNVELCRAAIQIGAHFCDLGGNTAIVKQELALHEAAKSKGCSVVPDCGLAPGLGNTLAAHAIKKFDACDSIQIRCGGLPQDPQGPLNYHLLFSVEGLINEYTGFAYELKDGEIIQVPTLTGFEEIDLPGKLGKGECVVTSGGTSTAPESFRDKVRNYNYKTIRFPGHWDKIRAFCDLGFFSELPIQISPSPVVRESGPGGEGLSPRSLTEALFTKHLSREDGKDITVLIVTAECESTDPPAASSLHPPVSPSPRRVSFTQTLLDYYDETTGFSAMERTTAFPATCVVEMQFEGLIPPGAIPLELSVPPEPYLKRLANRGLKITNTWSS